MENNQIKVSNTTNNNIMFFLKKKLNSMNVKFEDKTFSKSLYDRITNSIEESNKINYEVTFKECNLANTQFIQSKFMCDNILNTIRTKLDIHHNVTFTHKNIYFNINIYSEIKDKINIKKYIQYILLTLCFCLLSLNENSQSYKFNLDLYLTNEKKNIDVNFGNCVESKHINNGLSYSNNDELNIIIYRKEEWIKVFIHECFHAFNFDFHEEPVNFKKLLEPVYNIDSDFLVFESFVEFWARTINCAFFSYFIKKNISFKDFDIVFNLNINIERIFSISQANKLLKLFNLTYPILINTKHRNITSKIYKEKTNAFCYYIITAIMMYHYEKTLQWFINYNYDMFNFTKTTRQVIVYCAFLKHISLNKEMIFEIENISLYKINKNNPMKMVIFDIEI